MRDSSISMRLNNRFADGRRQLDGYESVGSEQTVLAALVDDPKIALAFGVRVGDERVNLVPLKRGFVPSLRMQTTNRATSYSALLRLVEVSLPLDFFLADAVRFIPVQFRYVSPAIP